MKYSKFDKNTLKALRMEMQAVLDKFGADSNLEFTIGNMTFSDAEVTIKVNSKISGVETLGDKMLDLVISQHNLVKTRNGATLIRYDSRKYQYPFIYSKGGKTYKTSVEGAKRLFAA